MAEVCSVYFNRAGEMLELFATVGLAREAVHQTRMRVGEGLVGTIAAQGKVINTADAQSHPNFRYFPETGEEIYHSFLGVPILRAGRVVGVLTVQNRARRAYAEDEIEAMQVIASILAEMFALGRADRPEQVRRRHRRCGRDAPARRARGWWKVWRSARRGCTSRGSRSPACSPRARRPSWPDWSGPSIEPARDARPDAGHQRPGRRRAARGARGLPHVRPGHAAGCAGSARRSAPASPPRPRSGGCRRRPGSASAMPATPICASG